VVPTDHVVIRGKFTDMSLTLMGYALGSGPDALAQAAQDRCGPLPAANATLPLPGASEWGDDAEDAEHGGAWQQQGPPPPLLLAVQPAALLPLTYMPRAFAEVLLPLLNVWQQLQQAPQMDVTLDIRGLEHAAAAVLAARQGARGARAPQPALCQWPPAAGAQTSTCTRTHAMHTLWCGRRAGRAGGAAVTPHRLPRLAACEQRGVGHGRLLLQHDGRQEVCVCV
jgi:hypothetical protein